MDHARIDASSEMAEGARAQRLIVVGGGRGGAGKSLVALTLAVYFAQLGKRVILVDADPTGANLHTHFGLSASCREPSWDEHGDERPGLAGALVGTNIPGLALLPGSQDAVETPFAMRAGRKSRWLSNLRALAADYLVVDAGPGHGHLPIDLMLAADFPITVTTPEPPAIEATYRFLRAAFRRRLRRAIGRDRLRRTILERVLAEFGTLPSPLALTRALSKTDTRLTELAWAEANRMRAYLVVNQTRVRTDLDLGATMSSLSARYLGVALEELGHIEYDDAVWLTVRRHKPLLIDSPASKAGRNLERIARRVFALVASPKGVGAAPPALPLEPPTFYELLGVTRSASDEEIRRAYRRQRDVYATGGLATASLFTDAELAAEQTRVEEAYDTLLDAVRRRAYDVSVFPEPERATPTAPAFRPALAVEQVMLQSEVSREIGPETEFTGPLLRKVRESQGVDLTEISAKTRIIKTHLQAIEEEDFSALPASVYVRGFVGELARYLKLDAEQVQRTYARRMRAGADP